MIRRFLRYVIPTIVSMWIYALYTMVDGMFVAWGVGEMALASVNLSMPYTILIYTIGILLATGTSTVVAIALGKRDERSASELFSMNIVITCIVAVLITILSLLFLDPLVLFLGAGPDNQAYVKEYVGTIAVFAAFIMLSYNMEMFVKTDGTPGVAVLSSLACGMTNVVLDYVFVMRFHWGVWGAAFATGLAQVISALIYLVYFVRFRKVLRFRRFRPDLSIYKRIIPLGLSNGFTELSGGVVIYMFNWTILRYIGEDGLVSYTVISYINTLVLNTMSGIAQGMQPLISYHFGAGEKRQYRTLLHYAVTMTAIITAIYCLALECRPDWFVGIFLDHDNMALFADTEGALRLYALSFVFLGFNVVSAGYFTAVEQAFYSFLISAGRGMVFIAIALMIMGMLFGANGIWLSPVAAEAVCAIMVSCLFVRRGGREATAYQVDSI